VASQLAQDLHARIQRRAARVGVVGLGYVGLPLALACLRAGFPVLGVDRDPDRVARLGRGQSPVEDVTDEELRAALATGRLELAAAPAALAAADAVLICVPTPLGKSREPDISHVLEAARAVAAGLGPGRLVVLESTTYPGTTEEVLVPLLERAGRRVGLDVFVAFSPERVDPGNRQFPLSRIPKVVGGCTPACAKLAEALYGQIVERVVPVSSPRAAEMIKLFENTFRAVNVALVNELALMCRRLGLSVWEVIEGAATKPFGFLPFQPGPGIGGHCLPSDPHYLAWKARLAGYEARSIAFAHEINAGMPGYVVELVADSLNRQGRAVRDARLLVLGVAYKAGVGDVRDAPAIPVVEALLAKGARVDYVDPHVPRLRVGERELAARPWATAPLGDYDLVLVLTAHPEFDARRLVREARLVVDTRNLTGATGTHAHVVRL
jgi:UDP-N-acetyl-D-glucosamine dehydrogenase